jgi:hypothetical protein
MENIIENNPERFDPSSVRREILTSIDRYFEGLAAEVEHRGSG